MADHIVKPPAAEAGTQAAVWRSAGQTLLLMVLLAALCQWLAALPRLQAMGIGSLPLSILLGMVLASVLAPRWIYGHHATTTGSAGTVRGGQAVRRFCQQTLLKLGIVLFGFRLTLEQLWGVGWQALLVDVVTIATVLILGIWLGQRWLKLPLRLSILIAVGSAVCGAAAIMATAPLLAAVRQSDDARDDSDLADRAGDEDRAEQHLAIAVALVALFGTLSVLLYPWLCQWFGFDSNTAGLYIGSTVHEVAQAVAATDALDPAVQHNALIVKLLRVALLAPTLLLLGEWLMRRSVAGDAVNMSARPQRAGAGKRLPVPGFVLGFIAAIIANSLLPLPQMLLDFAAEASAWCLMLAMVALGLNTRWQGMVAAGLRPLLLGLLLWLLLLAGGGWLNTLFALA